MTSINVGLRNPPTTPLNLQFGVIYAPRVPTPPLVGFDCLEVSPNLFHVRGYDETGASTVVYSGDLQAAWRRLASHLRMDVMP